jgi:hypothetical protein
LVAERAHKPKSPISIRPAVQEGVVLTPGSF